MMNEMVDKVIEQLPNLYIYAESLPKTRSEKEILEYSSAEIRCATLGDVETIIRNMHTSESVVELLR